MGRLYCTVCAADACPEVREVREGGSMFVCVEFDRVTVHLHKVEEAIALEQAFMRAVVILRRKELAQSADEEGDETPADTPD